MIELKNISKVYKNKRNKQIVLNNINLRFRDKEFVSILGKSGSGKSTLLNIIGGLDTKFNGSLLIDNIDTKYYKNKDYDNYRKNKVGFIFQNYNLINHQTVLDNVLISLKLSKNKHSKRKVLDTLKQVGLYDLRYKKPNELSGGEKQRVAIARAIVKNPNILLCDEPTGALDSKNSMDVLNILKDLSKEYLVVLITHNREDAYKYSDRIIELKDGEIYKDSNPKDRDIEIIDFDDKYKLKKNKSKNLSIFSSLKLSFKNLLNKRGRTFLILFAESIGIIGISLILILNNSMNNYINKEKTTSLVNYPLIITNEKVVKKKNSLKDNCNNKICIVNSNYEETKIIKLNNIKEKIEKEKDYILDISYKYDINLNTKINNNYFREMLSSDSIINNDYQILYGKYPKEYNELVLVLNNKGEFPNYIYEDLNIKEIQNIIGTKTILKTNKNEETLKIVGIIKSVDDSRIDSGYIGYTKELTKLLVKDNNLDINNPNSIYIYPKDYESRKNLINYLKKEKIDYQDLVGEVIDNLNLIIDSITYILILLVGVSFIVSSIMITILTYVSTIEREKEIGILRSLGATKKDIKHIFNSENIIEGTLSGIFGILIGNILIYPIGNILEKNIVRFNLIKLPTKYALILIILNILICSISGLIPSIIASNKDPVEALQDK